MKALITGASSGIGYEMAKYLSKKGYDLIVVSRRKETLEKLRSEVKTNVKIICMDLSINENCIKLHKEVQDEKIDVLINNAGFGMYGKFDMLDLDKEINMININIIACDILTKLFLKDMKKRDKGFILNVGSIAGFMPGPLMSSYYASKSYVVKLTEAIRKELKKSKSGVSVSVLCPGPVATNFEQVAGVKFAIKPLTSEYVAKYAIDCMFKRKLIIVPSLRIKLVRLLSKFTPDNIISSFVYKIQSNRVEI